MAKIQELMKVEDITICESTAQMITRLAGMGLSSFLIGPMR